MHPRSTLHTGHNPAILGVSALRPFIGFRQRDRLEIPQHVGDSALSLLALGGKNGFKALKSFDVPSQILRPAKAVERSSKTHLSGAPCPTTFLPYWRAIRKFWNGQKGLSDARVGTPHQPDHVSNWTKPILGLVPRTSGALGNERGPGGATSASPQQLAFS
jgi:hypothetical protein